MTVPTKTERCKCCDLPVYSCGRALELKQRREAKQRRDALLQSGNWIAATFPGRCSGCGEWTIKLGDPIRRSGDGWIAGCCARDQVVSTPEEAAEIDYRHFITTRPDARVCKGCGSLVLDGHHDGFHYQVDLDPVNRLGEIAAVLDSKDTYELDLGYLRLRTGPEMSIRSADDRPVLVQHHCKRLVPANHRAYHPPDPLAAFILELKIKYGSADCPPPF